MREKYLQQDRLESDRLSTRAAVDNARPESENHPGQGCFRED